MSPAKVPPRLLKTDVPSRGVEQEVFAVGMRQNMMEYDAHDTNHDRSLSFKEYSELVREREVGVFSEEVLHRRFDEIDLNHDHFIDMKEYVIFSLRDALQRSGLRVRDLFMQWDADNSGCIDRKEWRKAMKSLGIEATKEELDAVLVSFDLVQPDGTISYKELDKELRKLPAVPQSGPERDLALQAHQQHKLRRGPSSKPGSTLAATGMKLGGGGGSAEQKAKSIQEQLRDGLAANLTRVIDLFRDWDTDFSGTIDKKEFRKAVAVLGYEAPRADIDELFDSFDSDRGGFVDCTPALAQSLRRKLVARS